MAFEENNVNGLVYMTAPNISAVHAFTTRFGGVSGGIWSWLDLGENRGDEPEAVQENYRRLKAALGIGKLAFSRQVHGTHVRYVTSADAREPYDPLPREADGLVTDEAGLALIIFTADCIPILFHDPKRHIAAVAHAGWRGTVGDIAGRAVESMVSLGSDPSDIRAAIGPGISACCFETGPEVPEAVREVLGGGEERFIRPAKNEGKFFVDLKGVNRELIVRAGVPEGNIEASGECTMCRHEKYWSHRHTGGRRGTQASVVVCG